MTMDKGLKSWKRGTKTRSTLTIMSESSEAERGHQEDQNAYDYVPGFDGLEKGQ